MMKTTLQPEIISRETIKPSSPTPHHLTNFKLSSLDQLSPALYGPMLLFYPSEGYNSPEYTAKRLCVIKKSLSLTLSHYYPFSGKNNDRVSIDCNDEGVDVVEARIKCDLSEFLKQPPVESLNMLLPDGLSWKDSYKASVLVVQISFFDCGGMAIGLCLSHKISDAATIVTFLHDWAVMARQAGQVAPKFIGATVFPPNDQLTIQENEIELGKCVTRRYVFDASKIAALKAIAAGSRVKNPTKVELVTALICKCAIAASRAKTGSLKPACLVQLVNLRRKMKPSLPDNSIGNLAWFFSAWMSTEEGKMELRDLVGNLREGKTHFNNMEALNFRGEKWFSLIQESMKEGSNLFNENKDISIYKCSSWCGFPLYKVDFGWGKPIWVSTPMTEFKNTMVLLDTRTGDGIEAWVTLEEQDMALFERDKDLLAFASFNPSALEQGYESRWTPLGTAFGESQPESWSLQDLDLHFWHCRM